MRRLRPSSIAERERAYRARARDEQRAEAMEIERSWRRAPLAERRIEIARIVSELEREPEYGIVEERLRWLFLGTFGRGWQDAAMEIVALGPRSRQNRVAQLFSLLLQVDDRIPRAEVARIWRVLSPQAQRAITTIVTAGLRDAESGVYDDA